MAALPHSLHLLVACPCCWRGGLHATDDCETTLCCCSLAALLACAAVEVALPDVVCLPCCLANAKMPQPAHTKTHRRVRVPACYAAHLCAWTAPGTSCGAWSCAKLPASACLQFCKDDQAAAAASSPLCASCKDKRNKATMQYEATTQTQRGLALQRCKGNQEKGRANENASAS